jgi:hypothetical protein
MLFSVASTKTFRDYNMRIFTTARFEKRLTTFVHRRVRDLKRACGREFEQLERCVKRCASDAGYIGPGGDLHKGPSSGPYWSGRPCGKLQKSFRG